MQVRMDLAKIIITETEDRQIIVLKERDGTRTFPIVIGIAEACAIDRRLKGIQTLRPLTHELLASVIEQLGGQLEKIVINDLRDGTFYARLMVRQDGRLREIDSRPSDAIALGVATEVPVYVEEHVLREVCQ
ncbi:MAG: bifunctional nuclease family protein [Phycisphaerae bacterium]|nr:bifunctional nuclease family protein [Phycisphaerae bacterium]